MDTRNNNQDRNQQDMRSQQPEEQQTMGWERGERQEADTNDQPYIGADKDVSGNDINFEGRSQRAHHQEFGNRKYESNTNHSSADDQPMVNTGPGNF
ncbi:hypothetical protein [Flavobacterium silvaticum]|uniref:Uncharacterized protein n=1 Tax=Flavobacterium silvaticum TaxID=1852020 RepID=A0A972G240_9FLAO|nr:hypothetical protein [Flavobacterium silvaticum]NMH29061.1 hypothetical protein [Flavobacterium silvaticum]